ncbi:MAG: hypothetical protein Q9181_006407 [Wetmoreana brouardii]
MTAADEGVLKQTGVPDGPCSYGVRSAMKQVAARDSIQPLSLRGGAGHDNVELMPEEDTQFTDDSSSPAIPTHHSPSAKEHSGPSASDLLSECPSTPIRNKVSSTESSPLSSAPSNPRTPTPIRVVKGELKVEVDSPLSSAPSSPDLPSPNHTDIKEEDDQVDTKKVKKRKRNPKNAISGLTPSKQRKPSTKTSPYFLPLPKPPQEQVSCVPFPPLTSTSFGLVQESLASNPFHLLIAVIFLNKTRGAVAMPVFYTFIIRFPDPSSLATADHAEVVGFFQNLGLQNQRAKKCIALAKAWLEHPPTKGKRWRRLHYPILGDGKDIKSSEEPIADETEDTRVAWEVGHLPGIGAYGIDSWRIFCRDELRGCGTSALPEIGEDDGDEESRRKVEKEEMKREWVRVLPTDKELRAYLRWRWLRLGWEWDPMTGERRRAEEKIVEEAAKGGVICEGEKGWSMDNVSREGAIRRMGKLCEAEHGDGRIGH